MAVLSLVQQAVAFIAPNGQYDQNAILASPLVQSLASNSAGGDLVLEYKSYANWNGAVFAYSSIFLVTCFILPAFQATVQANIPNLQAAFPQYSVATWGWAVQFGN